MCQLLGEPPLPSSSSSSSSPALRRHFLFLGKLLTLVFDTAPELSRSLCLLNLLGSPQITSAAVPLSKRKHLSFCIFLGSGCGSFALSPGKRPVICRRETCGFLTFPACFAWRHMFRTETNNDSPRGDNSWMSTVPVPNIITAISDLSSRNNGSI